jgi:hypothetical protein
MRSLIQINEVAADEALRCAHVDLNAVSLTL